MGGRETANTLLLAISASFYEQVLRVNISLSLLGLLFVCRITSLLPAPVFYSHSNELFDQCRHNLEIFGWPASGAGGPTGSTNEDTSIPGRLRLS
jgi:hypothetical protein